MNLVLLLATALGLTVWYHRHLESYLGGIALIGGAVGIVSLFELAKTLIPDQDFSRSYLARRVLLHRHARLVLAVSTALTVLLLLLTSSIYLSLEDPAANDSYVVETIVDGRTIMAPTTLSSSSISTSGRPFIFDLRGLFSPRRVEFQIVDPPTYETVTRRLYPWSSLTLDVPGDFVPRDYHLLRIVPEPTLGLSPRSEATTAPFLITIEIDGKPVFTHDLRLEMLYCGESPRRTRMILNEEDQATREFLLMQRLFFQASSVEERNFAFAYAKLLSLFPYVPADSEFTLKSGQEFIVKSDFKADGTVDFSCGPFVVPNGSGIQTIYINDSACAMP